ncbi:hypothetical protein PVAND_010469 [Polypedilum vanderplanki]|uniref:Uncharacterized protein n=1 Tax=Polypedilum vanderplanki TaxID=319348 RepID=A0A9J6CHC7_POLVA|nr:hypothetical protein PVAND_010469 [Polypedilum vanderplanki]
MACSRRVIKNAFRLDNDLMFDDSTFGEDNTNQISHEHLRTKIVSKRSVNEPSDSDKNSEISLWQRIKRSVAGWFGYGDDEEKHQREKIEQPKVAELKASVPAQKLMHETNEVHINDENTQRRRRGGDYNDDEDDDEDNEIEGPSGNGALDENEHESTSDNEIDTPSLLPDVPDDKYFRIKLDVHEMWENLKDKHSDDYHAFASTIKKSIEELYKSKNTQHTTIMANLIEVREFKGDNFKVSITVNIAADIPKINGNELRDIINNEIKTYQRLGDHVVEPNSFVITNLEAHEYDAQYHEMQELEGPESEEDRLEDYDVEYECEEDEFMCTHSTNPRCISVNEVCDGIKQCLDGSDEKSCHGSESEYLETLNAVNTDEDKETDIEIPETTTTHTILDEDDGPINSDEENNLSVDNELPKSADDDYDEKEEEEKKDEKTIVDDCRGDDKFRCGKTSVYICEIQKCDGTKNCPNGEDEENCPSLISEDDEGSGGEEIEIEPEIIHSEDETTTTTAIPTTTTTSTTTSSTTTEHVPIIEDISAEEEIDTKSKEKTECAANEFNCDVSRCIPNDKLCDGTHDCEDGMDESNCPEQEPEPTTTEATISEYLNKFH